MNLELFESFANAVFPANAEKRNDLMENLKLGRFKEFEPAVMQEAVACYVDNLPDTGAFPELFCQDVQAVLPTHDRQNYKVLVHVAQCDCCSNKIT